MEQLARRLEMDAVELRAMNMVKPHEFPWVNPTGAVYDSGDYERCLRMAAEAVEWSSHRANGRGPGGDGRYRGVGFSSYVERTGYPSSKFLARRGSKFGAHESVTLRANRSGGIDLYTGVSSIGQGTETVVAQMVAEFFGLDYDAVTVHAGDTGASPLNTGAFASRTVIAAVGAVQEAATKLLDKTLRIAAWMLELADPLQLVVAGSKVRHRDDETVAVDLARVFDLAILGQGLPPGRRPAWTRRPTSSRRRPPTPSGQQRP